MDVAAVMRASDWDPFQNLGSASAGELDSEGVRLSCGASNKLCIDLLLRLLGLHPGWASTERHTQLTGRHRASNKPRMVRSRVLVQCPEGERAGTPRPPHTSDAGEVTGPEEECLTPPLETMSGWTSQVLRVDTPPWEVLT